MNFLPYDVMTEPMPPGTVSKAFVVVIMGHCEVFLIDVCF